MQFKIPLPKAALTMPLPSDLFDSLPDPVVLHILKKLQDVKVLGRCSAVSKRFNLLVPQVEDVVVKVDCVISEEKANFTIKGKGLLTHLLRLVMGGLFKPLHALQHLLALPKKCVLPEVSHHSPGEVLKNFKSVRNLRIELPRGELGIGKGVLLKWRAVFGSTLESCVILAASSMAKSGGKTTHTCRAQEAPRTEAESNETNIYDNSSGIPESFFTNGGLKLRVVWTISSLIAAAARHYLLQQVINEHPTLETLVLADADGQGTLSMHREQLQEFRDKPIAACPSSNRTQVPALNMKLWYAPSLDLTSGARMKGATLVAIQPSGQLENKVMNGFSSSAFEEPFKSAASSLTRRQTYLLEMNSF